MTFKTSLLLPLLFLAFAGCNTNTASKEEIAEKERIAFEKTADSLEQESIKRDTLNANIKNTSDEIDALLNEINN